jgi:hypothetical protein
MEVKMKKMLLGVFACLMLLSITVSPVSAKKTKTTFTGTSYYQEEISMERFWFPDGDRVHIRGLVETYWFETDDERLTGLSYQTSNCNFRFSEDPEVQIYGPIWGTTILENDGGYWEGHSQGVRTADGFNYHHEVLHGHGGYEGLMARIYYMLEITNPFGPMQAYGEILEPEVD